MTRPGLLGSAAIVTALLVAAIATATFVADERIVGPVHAIATGLDVPDLDDPGMIRRAAVHYDLVCATCHASPADPLRGTALVLSPPAPVLHRRIGDWPPSLLFGVVRDGVDGTAMPAWPAPERTDEVWAMVAFLRVLPELSASDYAGLAGLDRAGAGEGAPPLAGTCARCHGAPDAAAPRLGIQQAAYLDDALRAYRSGARASGFMQHLAQGLGDDEIGELAARFAEQEGAAPVPTGKDAAEGRDDAPSPIAIPPIAIHGAPERQIAACVACHDPGAPVRPAFPVLAGQHADYLATQLALFADDSPHDPVTRGGGPYVELMQHAAEGLTDAEIAELAVWFASGP